MRHFPGFSPSTLAAVLAGTAMFTSCSSPDDSASSLAAADGNAATALAFACESGKADLGEKSTKRVGDPGVKQAMSAEWCFPANSVGRLRVFFIVDRSGSMTGTDPNSADSCGRLAAAKA